jgi:serine protease AprX
MGKSKFFLIFFVSVFSNLVVYGQGAPSYLVYFTDKDQNPYSIDRPDEFLSLRSIDRRKRQNIPFTIEDLPVNPNYVEALTEKGVDVIFTSRWFNAAVIVATEAQLEIIKDMAIVKKSHQVARKNIRYGEEGHWNLNSVDSAVHDSEDILMDNNLFGNSWNQNNMLNVPVMHADGYNGQGILIGVLDAGFKNASELPFFQHLFDNNKILATYDFVDREESVFEDHTHGTNVLSIVAGYLENQLISPAYGADYILLRTENASTELQIEEANWLVAAEYADSAGVDIINSSLGYSTFDVPAMDYTYEDMDGNTSIITRAADIAVSKGILVITSAGNEGNQPWKYITAPADGHAVIAVGATNAAGQYATFSSIGPSADGRIKPDLSAQGSGIVIGNAAGNITTGSGTSYAAPLITGLAAGIWQSCRDMTVKEIFDILIKSGNQYKNPDNLIGFGIPSYQKNKLSMICGGLLPKYFIEAHPNPFFNDILKLKFNVLDETELTIKVFDVKGKEIESCLAQISPEDDFFEINTPSWLPGMYIIRASNDSINESLKIIKGEN